MSNYYIAYMYQYSTVCQIYFNFFLKRKCDVPTDDIQNEGTFLDTDTRNFWIQSGLFVIFSHVDIFLFKSDKALMTMINDES